MLQKSILQKIFFCNINMEEFDNNSSEKVQYAAGNNQQMKSRDTGKPHAILDINKQKCWTKNKTNIHLQLVAG